MLTARLATVAILLPLFVGGLFWMPNLYWGIFLLAGLFVASLEWGGLAGYGRAGRLLFAGIVILCGVLLLQVPAHGTDFTNRGSVLVLSMFALSAAFWLSFAPLWLIRKWRVRNSLFMAMAGGVVLLPAWLAMTLLQADPMRLLLLMGVVWIADSAAFVVGRRLGRHRLAPTISPGKTWEGVAGACAAVAMYYVVLWGAFGSRLPLPAGLDGAVVFSVITVMSIEGDLFESWIKRQAGVKDSGNLLPGHGGILDRIDGLTSSMPLAALILSDTGFHGIG